MKVIIKIGGSLIKKGPKLLRKIYVIINQLKESHQIVIIPGGGDIAECVRNMQKKYRFSDSTAHWMAILAMDMNGRLLCEVGDNFKIAESISNCLELIRKKFIPIFLVSRFLRGKDLLPHSWDVTSDSIAVFVASQIRSDLVILLKDVEGIYDGKRKKVIEKLTINELSRLIRRTDICVDRFLPQVLKKYKKDVYIVSGLHPERIREILMNVPCICTKIVTDDKSV